MSMLFNFQREEIILAQINDTGVAGATLTLKMYGKHVFFELKSPHAVMNLLNGNRADIKKLRKALQKAESIFDEKTEAGKVEIISRSQADVQVAKAKKTKSTDSTRTTKSTRTKKANRKKD